MQVNKLKEQCLLYHLTILRKKVAWTIATCMTINNKSERSTVSLLFGCILFYRTVGFFSAERNCRKKYIPSS